MPCMYILYSEKLKKYYISACIDMERRLYEHNIGHSKFTSLGIPWKLVYTEQFEDLTAAKKRELQVKKMKSRKISKNLFLKIIDRSLLVEHLDFNREGPIKRS